MTEDVTVDVDHVPKGIRFLTHRQIASKKF